MAQLSPDSLKVFGREVAAAVADGHSPEQISHKWDLSPIELEEIFESEPFTTALATYGHEVTEAWNETRASNRGGSVRRKISENLNSYYEALDKLATGDGLKSEKRADILLALMRIAAPPDEKPQEVVHMPPSLIENWARRHHEIERNCRLHRRYLAEEEVPVQGLSETVDATEKDESNSPSGE